MVRASVGVQSGNGKLMGEMAISYLGKLFFTVEHTPSPSLFSGARKCEYCGNVSTRRCGRTNQGRWGRGTDTPHWLRVSCEGPQPYEGGLSFF